MAKKLLIVESPAKAKTIGKYLGGDFIVKSSVGHIRDLPKERGSIKITEVGDKSWEFEPTYVISEGKTKVVNDLKAAVKDSEEIYLASDPDREGEAIAWHLKTVLESTAKSKPFRRVTYNEITKAAVTKAVAEPRDIDMPLVDAQQARRILDRLVGYKVSPLLWKNINCRNNRTLSAGRVQSVALRLLVERQREIDAFKPETYFLLGVEAKKGGEDKSFIAKLARLDGEKPEIKDRDLANRVLLDLSDSSLEVTDVKSQPKTRHTLPPFTTSTLQQAASSVLGFAPEKTMKLAQSLYEAGRITYMRTDSVNVSDQARAAAKAFIEKYCGAQYYPEKPNFFKSKEDAQGAHEAIRPTEIELSPKRAAEGMDATELKLYDLIWRRFVASQMADAKTTIKTISIKPVKPAMKHTYLFTASATTIDFDGFLKIMKLSLKKKTKDGEDDEDTDEVTYLPEVSVGNALEVVRWVSDEKQTKGPSHYSEASLIKALEENGVGRPSTYAATIKTLKDREYAKTEKKKLVPLERGILVCDWLVKNMDELFNVGYTAKMEAELDKVAEHGEPMNRMLSEFYAKFMEGISNVTVEPPPDRLKFETVFGLLAQVKDWNPAKKTGNRVYDDHEFYQSCLNQFKDQAKPMSARQLDCLIKMAGAYREQIPGIDEKMAEIGVTVRKPTTKANTEMMQYCFGIMDRIKGLGKNSFLKSLRDQYDHGRTLSERQLVVLAQALSEHCASLEDAEEIKAKLSKIAPNPSRVLTMDPSVSIMVGMLKQVKEWRPIALKGKMKYDDKSFAASLIEQFENRGRLSDRQIGALRKMCELYHRQIADYDQHREEIGLKKE